MKDSKLTFSLKTVSTGKVAKTMKSMKKKKSLGIDGLSQENLSLATNVLVNPLTSSLIMLCLQFQRENIKFWLRGMSPSFVRHQGFAGLFYKFTM